MKKNIALYLLLSGAMAGLCPAARGQFWMQGIPDNGTRDFREAITAFHHYSELHPGEKIPGEKQFRRMEWFMQRRMDSAGTFPARIFHEESAKIAERRKNRTPGSGVWSSLGPFLTPTTLQTGARGGSGRIDCLGFHPTNPSVVYVGTPTGGLWRTTDGGQSWTGLTDNLPTLGISAIAVHPQHPDTIFIATGTRDIWWETYSVGVMKSTDGGMTWSETGLNFNLIENKSTTGLIINPANPSMMLASTSAGLYRTLDGGEHWDLACTGNFKDIKSKPGDFSVIYATSFSFSRNGPCYLYKSTDYGANFSLVNNLGVNASQIDRMVIGVTPANPDIVYLACSNSTNYGFLGVFRSDNSGVTWTQPSAGCNLNLLGWNANGLDQGGQAWYDLSLSVSPVNPDELHIGGVNIWRSLDGGVSWQLNAHWQGYGGADYVHADIHELKYNPLDSVLYAGCDGGIYRLQEGGSDWLDLSDGLTIYQTYRLGLFPSHDDLAIVSPQDNGTTLFDSLTCKEIVLAEACDNFFDHTNSNTIYYGGYGTGLSRSYNGGLTRNSIQPPGESKNVFLPPFLMHPTDPGILYSAFHEAYRSDNRGTNWTKITNGQSGNNYFQVMKVAPSNPDCILLSTVANIWITRDGGATWSVIHNGLPVGLTITDIGISDSDPDQIWVTFGQFIPGEKVYHSHDGGKTWTNVSFNLPNMPVDCILPVENSNSAVYVGTDAGVYYMDDGTGGWVDYSDGLPNVIVLELEINSASHKIKAATYGRGLWEAPLYDSPTSAPAKNVAVSPHLYPNPVSDDLRITFATPLEREFAVEIYGMNGRVVFRDQLRGVSGYFDRQIRLDFLPKGVYLLELKGASGISCHRKIVKL